MVNLRWLVGAVGIFACETAGAWNGPKASVFATPLCQKYACRFVEKEAQPAGYKGTHEAQTSYYYVFDKLRTDPRDSGPDQNPVLQVTRDTLTGMTRFVAISWLGDDFSLGPVEGRQAVVAVARTYIPPNEFRGSRFKNADELAAACYTMTNVPRRTVFELKDRSVACGYSDSGRFIFAIE